MYDGNSANQAYSGVKVYSIDKVIWGTEVINDGGEELLREPRSVRQCGQHGNSYLLKKKKKTELSRSIAMFMKIENRTGGYQRNGDVIFNGHRVSTGKIKNDFWRWEVVVGA